MSIIEKLSVFGVRNIDGLYIEPTSTLNILHGENGSGKTSILESIHLLASGRSFRTRNLEPLINSDKDEAVVFARLVDGKEIGLSKSRRQKHNLKFRSKKQSNWENVARELIPIPFFYWKGVPNHVGTSSTGACFTWNIVLLNIGVAPRNPSRIGIFY
jgi:recombinational DNA repair ATPase RecF